MYIIIYICTIVYTENLIPALPPLLHYSTMDIYIQTIYGEGKFRVF